MRDLDLVDESLSGEGVLLSLVPELLVDGKVLELRCESRLLARQKDSMSNSRSGRT